MSNKRFDKNTWDRQFHHLSSQLSQVQKECRHLPSRDEIDELLENFHALEKIERDERKILDQMQEKTSGMLRLFSLVACIAQSLLRLFSYQKLYAKSVFWQKFGRQQLNVDSKAVSSAIPYIHAYLELCDHLEKPTDWATQDGLRLASVHQDKQPIAELVDANQRAAASYFSRKDEIEKLHAYYSLPQMQYLFSVNNTGLNNKNKNLWKSFYEGNQTYQNEAHTFLKLYQTYSRNGGKERKAESVVKAQLSRSVRKLRSMEKDLDKLEKKLLQSPSRTPSILVTTASHSQVTQR